MPVWTETTPLVLMGVLGAIFGVLLFWRQVKGLFRLLGRAALWCGALALLSPAAERILGLHLGVNPLNALLLALLGLPGLAVLAALL